MNNEKINNFICCVVGDQIVATPIYFFASVFTWSKNNIPMSKPFVLGWIFAGNLTWTIVRQFSGHRHCDLRNLLK